MKTLKIGKEYLRGYYIVEKIYIAIYVVLKKIYNNFFFGNDSIIILRGVIKSE